MGERSVSHVMLCQMYDASHAAALILQEQSSASGGALPTVCLIDVSTLSFTSVPRLGGASGDIVEDEHIPLPPSLGLHELNDEALKRSEVLPESYVWSSAMRCMSSR